MQVNLLLLFQNTRPMKYEYFLFFTLLLLQINSGPILDNLPITFEMLGQTTYNPDSGAATLKGYKLKIGYTGHSWIAVEFSDNLRSDVLVVTADDFYTKMNEQFSGHQILMTDYNYNTSAGLTKDKNTTNDISAFNYSNQKAFELTMTRFLGSMGGEDWSANTKKYTVQKICFYTSDTTFNISSWNQGSTACYHFEIDNLTSKFVGKSLKSFTINGYTTKIYGWIDGPYLTDNVYIFQESPLFTYKRDPALILQLGETDGGDGQDFYVSSPLDAETGDYFGASVATIKKDSSMGGFENNGFSAKFWNTDPAKQISDYSSTALRMMFSRNVSTFDDYDRKLSSTFIFCLHIYAQGSMISQVSDKSCEIVELSQTYVKDYIKNKAFGETLRLSILTLLSLLVVMWYL